MAMIVLSVIYALRDRFHNFILPFLRGEDHVCQCTCGRTHQACHVVPYHGALSTDSRPNYHLSQQESSMMAGLLLGLCISWFLLWLLRDARFCSWMPKFSHTRKLQHTEEANRGTPSEIFMDASNT